MARSAFGQTRPMKGGVAFPFSLRSKLDEEGANASTVTLTGQSGIVHRMEDEGQGSDGKTEEDLRSAEQKGVGEDGNEEHGPEIERFETAKEEF